MKKVATAPKKTAKVIRVQKTKPVTLEGVVAAVDKMDAKTNRIETAVDALGARTTRIEAAVDALGTRTTRIEKAVGRMEGAVDKLSVKVDKLSVNMDKLTGRVGTLEKNLEKTAKSLSASIERSIDGLALMTQRGFADMEKRMVTKEEFERRMDEMVTKKEFNAYAENDGRTTILILSEIESIKHRMELADEDRRKKDLALQAHDARITQLEAVV